MLAPATDVAVAAGTLGPDDEPSVIVAWVESEGASTNLRVANFFAARNAEGEVQSLEFGGPVLDLGPVLEDEFPGGGTRVSSPALAIGDFAQVGSDQVAVAWAPAGSQNGARRFSATLLDSDASGGLQTVVAPQTIDAQIDGSPNASPLQIGPGAVAQHDTSGAGPDRDRLIIGPGIQGDRRLYRLTPSQVAPRTFEVETVTDTFVVGSYNTFHWSSIPSGTSTETAVTNFSRRPAG